MATRLGFVGLGNIGLPMARRLVLTGHPPTVYDVRDEPLRVLANAGAYPAESPAAVAAASDVVGVCVRDETDLLAAITGPAGVLAGAEPGCVIAIHSTVDRATIVEIGLAAAAHVVTVLDACVAGGAVVAAEGKLTVMVGGPADAVARARPLFEAFARTIVHTGPLGTGTTAKLCNQIMQYVAWTAAHEALALARAAGLAPELVEAVTSATGVAAESTQRFFGLCDRPSEVRASPSFQAALRGFVAIAEKDLRAALALGREHHVTLPATSAVLPLMARIYGVEEDER